MTAMKTPPVRSLTRSTASTYSGIPTTPVKSDATTTYVAIAWSASYAVAGIGAALFAGEGASLLYPLEDARYVVRGRLVFSTREGVVQTFLVSGAEGGGALPLRSVGGAVADPVASWVNPDGRPGLDASCAREFRFVEAGWQLVVVAAAVATLAVRFRLRRRDGEVTR